MHKYVLTGGNGSGKTSLLLVLQLSGEKVVRESASDFLYVERAKGNLFPLDNQDAEEQILRIQIEREKHVDICKRVFLDRSTIDHFVYARLLRQKLSENIINKCSQFKYDIIFLIKTSEEFGIGLCTEREYKYSIFLEKEIIKEYENIEYKVIIIEPDSIENRLIGIKERIKAYENK